MTVRIKNKHGSLDILENDYSDFVYYRRVPLETFLDELKNEDNNKISYDCHPNDFNSVFMELNTKNKIFIAEKIRQKKLERDALTNPYMRRYIPELDDKMPENTTNGK